MTEIQLTQHREQDTAVLHERVPTDQIKALFDRALPAVMAAVAKQGGHPVGPPFAKYFGTPGDTVEVEVGFPVARAVAPSDGVRAGTLPGGPAVRAMHVGPYDRLPATYDAMFAWMKGEGLEPADAMWEVYLSDPVRQPDPETWRTEVWWPVA
jgi:effector-binding domain-containing protein